jgi:hypothetical protein
MKREFYLTLAILLCCASLPEISRSHSSSRGIPSSATKAQSVFRYDLHPLGFHTDAGKLQLAGYTDLAFLSDDLLLLTVNERVFGPVEQTNADTPASKVCLFSVSRKALQITGQLAVEKRQHSVQATRDEEFVLFNESGVQICSADLKCGRSLPTEGPLLVSLRGTRIRVGGFGNSVQRIMDSSTLELIESFPAHDPDVIPGDENLLLRYTIPAGVLARLEIHLRVPGKHDRVFDYGGGGVLATARFLDDNTWAGFTNDSAMVTDTDGAKLYSIPIKDQWNSEFVNCRSGSRFAIHESAYTRWNSIINFLDIDQGRPFNVESVRIFGTKSGKEAFNLSWNPQPYVGILPTPSLSPDGKKLAVIQHGYLEIFEIP